jgi:hypothetical protein
MTLTLTSRDASSAWSLTERDFPSLLPSSGEVAQVFEVLRRRAVGPREVASAVIYRVHYAISPELAARSQIFNAIQALYQSRNNPRDRQIVERLTALYRDALSEDETLDAESATQFAEFFLQNPGLGMPKITLTPDGTLRARWIRLASDFAAIEFTGTPIAKFVAEIPRQGDLTARYFSGEPVENVVPAARAIGAFLG